MEQYIVYVLTDSQNRITDVQSSAFLTETDGWVEIDRGTGDRYHHAQGNYLPKPVTDERGVCRYKLHEGQIVERTQEEMDADIVAPEPVPETGNQIERIEALEAAIAAIQEGIASV